MKAVLMAGCLTALNTGFALAEGPANLKVSYLSEPTAWCAKDAGIPVVLELTNLTVYEDKTDVVERRVTVVRRGTEVRKEVTTSIQPGIVRNRRGNDVIDINSASSGSGETKVDRSTVRGTLNLTTRLCDLFWQTEFGETSWTLMGPEGALLESGQGSPDFNLWRVLKGREQRYDTVSVEKTRFLVDRPLETHRTIETFVSPTKEHTQ